MASVDDLQKELEGNVNQSQIDSYLHMMTYFDFVAAKQAALEVLETCKQSLEICIATKDASLDQWKVDHADLEKKLAEAHRRIQDLESDILTKKHRIQKLMLQERRKFDISLSPIDSVLLYLSTEPFYFALTWMAPLARPASPIQARRCYIEVPTDPGVRAQPPQCTWHFPDPISCIWLQLIKNSGLEPHAVRSLDLSIALRVSD